MKLIKQMAFKTNVERMNLLTNYLDVNDVKYTVQYVNDEEGNIIIDYVTGKDFLLIVAHYDVIEGSSGANDNASGILVVLELIKKRIVRSVSCRIVFTTMEEQGGKGIEKYIQEYGTQNIYCAINLDSCGWGKYVVLCNRGKRQVIKAQKKVRFSNFMPYGDDAILEDYGVDVISVSTMDNTSYYCFSEIGVFECNGLDVSKELIEEYNKLHIFDTMHCGEKDCIEIVSKQNIRRVTSVILKLLKNYRSILS